MKNLIILILALTAAFALPSKELKALRPEGRIAKGRNAYGGQFPYQASLYLNGTNSKFFSCSGSLIGNKWILTAAHCLVNTTGGKVALGSVNHMAGQVLYNVTKNDFIIHNYNPVNHENDIGLIKIPDTEYTRYIQAVSLPDMSSHYSDYIGQFVSIAGWGLTNNSPNSQPKVLQFERFTIIPNAVCRPIFSITNNEMCTPSTNGVNICEGDSGAPVVLDSSKIQIGIVSIADESCVNNYPAIHTRVTSYLQWIKDVTGISYISY